MITNPYPFKMKTSLFISALMLLFMAFACTPASQQERESILVPEPVAGTPGAFEATYSEDAIQFLKNKLKYTRFPDEIPNAAGKYGYAKASLQSLLNYWEHDFDFSQHLARINAMDQYISEIDGLKLHYVWEKSGAEEAIPIVLLHGWPSTYLQMSKLVPLLTQGDNGMGFDVVVISLPGYGFSEIPTQEGMAVHTMADYMQRLMTEELGYEQFVLRASDIGAGVAKEWALAYPEHVMGLHLSGSSPYIFYMPNDLSPAEQSFVQNAQAFMQRYGAYASLHSTEPQTLGFALNDSPTGLAAWILQRYQTWTDHGGNLESVYTQDDLLDILTVYWMTGTINASMRSYFESATVYSPNAGKQVQVPTAFLMLKKDIAAGPREWEARTYAHIIQWNEHENGGHFGEWEHPRLVAEDIRTFARLLLNE